MIDAVLAASLMLAPSDNHAPSPSRHAVNRYMDSGDMRVWKGVPTWIRSLSLCVRRHESITAGHYKARNGHSSAAGAYQFIRSTWAGNARYTPLAKKWAHVSADKAPPFAQDAVFIHVIKHGGIRAWRGTGCPGT